MTTESPCWTCFAIFIACCFNQHYKVATNIRHQHRWSIRKSLMIWCQFVSTKVTQKYQMKTWLWKYTKYHKKYLKLDLERCCIKNLILGIKQFYEDGYCCYYLWQFIGFTQIINIYSGLWDSEDSKNCVARVIFETRMGGPPIQKSDRYLAVVKRSLFIKRIWNFQRKTKISILMIISVWYFYNI